MSENWYFAKNGRREGPVSFERLKQLARSGWLARDDLVWQEGMADWIPAGQAEGLFAGGISRLLQKPIAGLRPRPRQAGPASLKDSGPPTIPPEPEKKKPQRRKPGPTNPVLDVESIAPRHVVAACGGFLAALGIAFTAIAQSRLALALTLSGLFVAAVGLYVEISKLLGQAIENIGKASKEAADRRLRAKELALEKRRLDVEAARLAQEQAARMVPPVPAAVLANQQGEYVPGGPSGPGQVVVINQPPMQRWSPGLAAVLSFLVPGLGQLYKGQILNAIMWFFLVGIGYLALILPGLVLHFFCILGALSGNPWTEGKTTVVRH